MTLEQLRAAQREHLILDADLDLDDFLEKCSPERALADREPATDIERRHLARVRRSAS
ncbi:MAG: hypothetical protein HIU88_10140 [Acidobacteria bacterium]|nr:hypothetical protein [Acidobacteriota bacterium]